MTQKQIQAKDRIRLFMNILHSKIKTDKPFQITQIVEISNVSSTITKILKDQQIIQNGQRYGKNGVEYKWIGPDAITDELVDQVYKGMYEYNTNWKRQRDAESRSLAQPVQIDLQIPEPVVLVNEPVNEDPAVNEIEAAWVHELTEINARLTAIGKMVEFIYSQLK